MYVHRIVRHEFHDNCNVVVGHAFRIIVPTICQWIEFTTQESHVIQHIHVVWNRQFFFNSHIILIAIKNTTTSLSKLKRRVLITIIHYIIAIIIFYIVYKRMPICGTYYYCNMLLELGFRISMHLLYKYVS